MPSYYCAFWLNYVVLYIYMYINRYTYWHIVWKIYKWLVSLNCHLTTFMMENFSHLSNSSGFPYPFFPYEFRPPDLWWVCRSKGKQPWPRESEGISAIKVDPMKFPHRLSTICQETWTKIHLTVDGRIPANQLIWSISHYLHGFVHPRCRISSINSIKYWFNTGVSLKK